MIPIYSVSMYIENLLFCFRKHFLRLWSHCSPFSRHGKRGDWLINEATKLLELCRTCVIAEGTTVGCFILQSHS